MRISPLTFQVKLPDQKILQIGNYYQFNTNPNAQSLPRNRYEVYTPVIGKHFQILGKKSEDYREALTQLIRILLYEDDSTCQQAIKKYLTIYEVVESIIYQFYFNLKINHEPWQKNKKNILEKKKPIFISLLQHGATWLDILDNKKKLNNLTKEEVIEDLTTYVYGPDSLGHFLASADLGGLKGFETYCKKANFLLKIGANINGINTIAPQFGSFLHRYLANELAFGVELIEFIESKRLTNSSNTHFNYRLTDEMNQTPLLIAILTRQEQVVLKLLRLHEKGIDVGINIPDKHGRTPLLIAAAVGLPTTVSILLKSGANPLTKDKQGLSFNDYMSLNDDLLKQLLLPFLHPDRGNLTRHSYLYNNDVLSIPLCLYEDNEKEQFGDDQYSHLVVLSPLPHHQIRLNKIITFLKKEDPLKKPYATDLLKSVIKQKIVIGDKTILAVCKEGQKEVQKELQSPLLQNYINLAKEHALRRACAVGDLTSIKNLLIEGTNPNAQDHLGRTALHFTVMRFELVKKELYTAQYELGFEKSITDREVIQCMMLHEEALTLLLTQSKIPVDPNITNKSDNTAESILIRDSKKIIENDIDKIDVTYASKCLVILNSFFRTHAEQLDGANIQQINLSQRYQ